MRKSSRRISGLSLLSILMQSFPLEASPTMVISSSPSRSLRRPSRKMAWSSAIRTRICCFVFLAISAERDLNGQTRTMPRSRFHCQDTTNASRPFFDRYGPESQAVQLVARKAACKAKPLPVIVHNEDYLALILPQFYHYV